MAAIKALFAVFAVAAVSVGLLLPVPGARGLHAGQSQFELLEVGR